MRISIWVAVSFAFALLAVAGASAAVAVVEPGIERVVASLVGGASFVLVALGMLKSDDWVSPVKWFLGKSSLTYTRAFVSAGAMHTIGIAALLLGPCRLYSESIACVDAKSIMFSDLLDERTELCSTASRATFTTWHLLGRAHLLRSAKCNYENGSQALLIEEGKPHCPVHEFSYVYGYDGGTWAWERSVDGTWHERGAGKDVSSYREIGVTKITSQDMEEPASEGMVMQRTDADGAADLGGLQVFVPDIFSGHRILYFRNTPKDDWQRLGVVVRP